ncbi:hypothetical protein FRC17_007526 [Serendipita sp. 399]|nr:hypothetical protein FRC17_007526 [Serendipita sp. 399]
MEALLQNVKDLGADIQVNATFKDLVYGEEGKVAGAILEDGRTLYADIVVLSMGAWTPQCVPSSILGNVRNVLYKSLIATGQPILTIKLSQELAKRYQSIPVTINWETGFCTFPVPSHALNMCTFIGTDPDPQPNEEGRFKIIHHSNGYTNELPLPIDNKFNASAETEFMISTPRTLRSHGTEGTRIPSDLLQYLHAQLEAIYPELAKLPLETTRLCWYMDTPDENFLIDSVPGYNDSFFIATGGSGHAFKFLPVIGRLVKDRIEGRMEAAVAARFGFFRRLDDSAALHKSRQGQPKRLDESTMQLWSAEDLNKYILTKDVVV